MNRALLPLLALLATAQSVSSATLSVDVRNQRGEAIVNSVVYAIPRDREVPPPSRQATMDQFNRKFVPYVLPVQTGTAVQFPNSDNVRHQVYSFSPVKKFQIPLYEGTPANPIVFDKPGVVTLGCNIHDRMSAYIVVVDTPYFARAEDGRALLDKLPSGTYSLYVWHPRLRGEPEPRIVTVDDAEAVDIEMDLNE